MAERYSKPDLSIIILNYNVKDLLLDCLKSVYQDQNSKNWQVIVVDNASIDNSVEALKKEYPQVEIIESKENLGFARGNNLGVPKAKADFILFLNPDTKVLDNAISKSLAFLKTDEKIGGLTCKVVLPDGRLDYSCHRGFPTPWNAFAYFSGLSKLFPKSKLFSGYSATYLDVNTIHPVDCGNGTFLMVRKQSGEEINWWSSDYFWNGEDIEFCYNLKEKGWQFYYYPRAQIIHYKGSSSGLWNTGAVKVNKERKLKSAKAGTMAMRIFYKKHFYKKYPPILRDFVLLGINLLEKYRVLKITLS
ncbi:glycosyltransferase family 2 protein [Candidatus Daviesbacteria bacterium]|nr:glycosyltransferase family 2 protein [Candidatus Daviesbacteria bacterium]